MFGRSIGEAQSIQQLAQILAPVTRQFLEQAGLCAGMKVLEVGSGAGDVALLAAELVGPSGTVIGVDNNPAILETARARTQAARLTQVSFVESDLTDLVLDDTFDAVVGRYILQHLRDPVLALRQLVRHLRPGGIVAFQEADLTRLGTSVPPVPLFETHYMKEGNAPAVLHENVLFYKSFGCEVSESDADNPDHLRHQLAFLLVLFWLEDRSGADRETSEGARRARREFIERHLRSWVPRAAAQAEKKAHPLWGALLRALDTWLAEAGSAEATGVSEKKGSGG